MIRSSRVRRAGAVLAAAAGLTFAGLALAPAAPAAAAGFFTCNDPRTGQERVATVVGTPGNDVIWARTGDVIVSLEGADTIYTNVAGNAVICSGDGADYVGNSSLFATSAGSVGVRGGDGRDHLVGSSGNDYVFGGPGDDVLDGRTGFDTLNGAEGVDGCASGEYLINCER